MRIDQVSFQPYTIRKHFRTPHEIRESLQKVAAIGYKAVECGNGYAVDCRQFREICDELGLAVSSFVEAPAELLRNPQAAMANAAILGTTLICYIFPAGIDFASRASVDAWIQALDRTGETLRKAGYTLTYHNHGLEFRRLDGQRIIDRIFDETNPANLSGELDTYWLHAGGGDPERWVRRLKGRLPILHIKDYGINAQNQPAFFEIGHGGLDFSSIIPAAEESGCRCFVVEQDETPGDPFESLEKSFRHIQDHLLA